MNFLSEGVRLSSYEDAEKMANILIEEGYVVMMAKECDLYALHYIFPLHSGLNQIIFMDKDDIEALLNEKNHN